MVQINSNNYSFSKQYGLMKERKCIGCGKPMKDDGSSMYLRGFCSEVCRDKYVATLRAPQGAYSRP